MTFTQLKQGLEAPLNEQLSLRLIRKEDLDEIIDMLNDPVVNRYLYFAPAERSVFEGYFGSIITQTEQAIASESWPESATFIIRDSHGRYMGMTAIMSVMFLEGNYDIGFQLPKHAWGQGIATQAGRLMTKIGFEALGAHKISADCFGHNVGSYKALENCGFVREGCQADYYKTENGFEDKLFYGMTSKQYFATITES